MIPNPSRTNLIVELRVTGLRPKCAHNPDLRHVLPPFLFPSASLFPRVDIPLDNISLLLYAFSVESDRGTRAIPIGAEGASRL